MITMYAMSLISKRWSPSTRAQLVDAVSDWLAEAYPYETRPTTTTVRVREDVDGPVFRVEINESDKRNMAVHQTIIAVAVLEQNLVFEIRKVLRPTGQSVFPRPRISVPNARLSELCVKIADELKIRDAEQLIDGQIRQASTTLDGEALAAFAEAPGRRLPIVVEHTQGRIPSAHATATLGPALLGIAHVFHVTTAQAVSGFNEFRRERLLAPDSITIIWPAPHAPTQIFDKDAQHVLPPLFEAASASLQPLFLPPLERGPAKSGPPVPRPVPIQTAKHESKVDTTSPQIAILESDNVRLQAQVEDLIRTQGELLENIGLTDLHNAALVDERDRYKDQLTSYLTLQSSSAWPRTPKEAVAKAMGLCPNLIFHVRSRTSADDVQTQNGKRILESLYTLNNLASQLKDGRIPLNMFEIYCRDRLNFAADVGDTAKNKFPEDYAIDWHGETVFATPHIRCGDIRIHFYIDRIRLQVVVAYVGRHLRDKNTN